MAIPKIVPLQRNSVGKVPNERNVERYILQASTPGLKEALHNYLHGARVGMLAKVDGLNEYDRRRPMTPTGTNLLGLVKHLTFYESYYLGSVFGREPEWTLPWIEDDSIWQGADMWATPDETTPCLLGCYQGACAHADATVATLKLDMPALVPWWKEGKRNTTLGVLLTHMIAETEPAPRACRD